MTFSFLRVDLSDRYDVVTPLTGPHWSLSLALQMNWALYTFLTELPKFLKQRLAFDIKASGAIEILPYLAMFITSIIGGKLCDVLINILSRPHLSQKLSCVLHPLHQTKLLGRCTPRRVARTLFQGIVNYFLLYSMTEYFTNVMLF